MELTCKDFLQVGSFYLVITARQCGFYKNPNRRDTCDRDTGGYIMAFSIKQVKAKLQEYGVPTENLDSAAEYFCAAHKTDLDAIIEQRDTYKASAETLVTVQKELDELKAAGDGGLSVLQTQYNTLKREHDKTKKEFDAYKAEQETKETHRAKEAAFRAILKKANISEKRVETVVKAANADGVIDKIELDENGGAKDADNLENSVKADWADFVVYTTTHGADISHPPAATSGVSHAMTKEQIDAITNTAERQAAMLANRSLYDI